MQSGNVRRHLHSAAQAVRPTQVQRKSKGFAKEQKHWLYGVMQRGESVLTFCKAIHTCGQRPGAISNLDVICSAGNCSELRNHDPDRIFSSSCTPLTKESLP